MRPLETSTAYNKIQNIPEYFKPISVASDMMRKNQNRLAYCQNHNYPTCTLRVTENGRYNTSKNQKLNNLTRLKHVALFE